jgi:type IV pilus assembly protein PilE
MPLRAHGFTLIELMIVVLVLGIIAAVAFPSYTNQVQKARRADATSALLEEAQRLERCFTRFNLYFDSAVPGRCPAPAGPTEGSFYNLDTSTVAATTYTLRAAPAPGTSQATDGCGTFTLTHTGQRGWSGPATGCWGTP